MISTIRPFAIQIILGLTYFLFGLGITHTSFSQKGRDVSFSFAQHDTGDLAWKHTRSNTFELKIQSTESNWFQTYHSRFNRAFGLQELSEPITKKENVDDHLVFHSEDIAYPFHGFS